MGVILYDERPLRCTVLHPGWRKPCLTAQCPLAPCWSIDFSTEDTELSPVSSLPALAVQVFFLKMSYPALFMKPFRNGSIKKKKIDWDVGEVQI